MEPEKITTWEPASFNEQKDPHLWQIKTEVVHELMILNCQECRSRAGKSAELYRREFCERLRIDPETAELLCKTDCEDYTPQCDIIDCEHCTLAQQLLESPFLPIQQLLLELNEVFANMPVEGWVWRLKYNIETHRIDLERVPVTERIRLIDDQTGEVFMPIGEVEKIVREPIYGKATKNSNSEEKDRE